MTIAYDLSLSGFPLDVKMLFGEQSSPLGWTKDISWYDDSMLCFNIEVDGTSLDSGGDINPQDGLVHAIDPFTVDSESGHTHTHDLTLDNESSHTHSGSGLTMSNHYHVGSGHNISKPEMARHRHTYSYNNSIRGAQGPVVGFAYNIVQSVTSSVGSGSSHNHSNTGSTPSATNVLLNTGSLVASHTHPTNGSVTGGLSHTHNLSGNLGDHGILRYQEVILCIKD